MNSLLTIAVEAAERGQWWPDSTIGRFLYVVGFTGQIVFAGRFIVQWIASEKHQKVVVPEIFWYLSIAGGLMLFTYAAFWKHDLVVTVGQTTGIFVYVRNLMLVRRGKMHQRQPL